MDNENVILKLGDCVEIMREMNAESVDLTVTSPPYDLLRTYGGHEWNFDVFKQVAKELYRITKNGGVVVWVVGDETKNGSESLTSFRQVLFFNEIGFNVHDTMIYEKNNFSNPSFNRYHQSFEYMFILSKGSPKTFNSIKDKQNACAGETNWGKNTIRQKDGTLKEHAKRIVNPFGMRTNIWKYNTGYGFAGDTDVYGHPAVFPEQLANDHIISWSNEGDLVFDPFMGSGTTGKVAVLNNRWFMGCEIFEDYFKIAKKRIKNTLAKQGKEELVVSEGVKMTPLFGIG